MTDMNQHPSQPNNQQLDKWSNLQSILKDEYILVMSEQQQKTSLEKKLNHAILTFHRNYVHLSSTKKNQNENRLFENQGFLGTHFFLNQIIITLSKHPIILHQVIKYHSDQKSNDSLKSLGKVIANNMYQNIVDDNLHNKPIFQLLENNIKIITNQKKYFEIDFNQINFINLIIKQFIDKYQLKCYAKQVVRNTLLEIAKIDKLIEFKQYQVDQDKIKKKTTRTTNLLQYQSTINLKTKKSLHSQTSKIQKYAEALKNKDSFIKQTSTKGKNKNCVSHQLMSYLGLTEYVNFPSFVSSNCQFDIRKQEEINRQWSVLLIKGEPLRKDISDIQMVKNIVLIFFSDIFRTLYSMPTPIRMLAAMIYKQTTTKYPNNKKASLHILANFIFSFWIVPYISFDRELIQAGKISNILIENAKIISNVLIGVIRNDAKNIHPNFIYFFNQICLQIRTSIFNYLTEVITINNINYQDNKQIQQQIKSNSICLTLRDIQLLIKMTKKTFQGKECGQVEKKLLKGIKRVQQMTQNSQILFGQRVDQQTGKKYKPQYVYVVFTQLQLPKQLTMQYNKAYLDHFKSQKIKNLIRLVLLNLDNLKSYFSDPNISLKEMLKQLLQREELGKLYVIDRIPNLIKMKYLVSLSKNIQLEAYINQMGTQAVERLKGLRKVSSQVKQYYLKAISNIGFHNEKVAITEQDLKLQHKKKILQQFLYQTNINICLTSPKTRQKEIISKTNLFKDTSEEEKSRLWLQHQDDCMHTVLNLDFMISITGQPQKTKKYQTHCNSIMKFPQILCSLPQLKDRSFRGDDTIGIKEVFSQFIRYCIDVAKKQNYSLLLEDEKWLQEAIEQKLSKKIYDKIFPKLPTYQDIALYLRLKTLSWIGYQELKIKDYLRLDTIWEIAARHLRVMERMKTADEKLNCIVECSKIILKSYQLANPKNQPATADDIFPIMVYVVLRCGSKKMLSNIDFIEYFGNNVKLKSKEGYYFTQLKSAIQFCDRMNNQHVGMNMIQFNRLIYEKQIEYGIYFLLGREKLSPRSINKKLQTIKEDYFEKKIQNPPMNHEDSRIYLQSWLEKQLQKKLTQ